MTSSTTVPKRFFQRGLFWERLWRERNRSLTRTVTALLTLASAQSFAQTNPAQLDWQRIADFSIARTETTIAQFRRFVNATKLITLAEKNDGGEVYESGWTKKPGWNWQAPFGKPGADDEPAAHISFDEAQAFCRWAGGTLPTDKQWVSAAYTEQRTQPTQNLERGKSYPFPTGNSAVGAQCLGECGDAAKARAINHGAKLLRGDGHARAGSTPAGVNGLHEMGANLWEWVDEPLGQSTEKRTRGGSWWYGQAQMRADYLQSKPVNTTVVYIGFRCVKSG